MILAYFFPYQANANKEKPLVFTVDHSLQKPLIIYRPYFHELKRPASKVNRPIPRKVSDKKENQQPVKSKSTTADYGKSYGTGEIQDLIRKYAQLYGIQASTGLCIAKLESGFNPNAKNRSSSAGGVFQFLESTFANTSFGKAGHSRFEADANIHAAIQYMAEKKSTRPWVVASKCPVLQPL